MSIGGLQIVDWVGSRGVAVFAQVPEQLTETPDMFHEIRWPSECMASGVHPKTIELQDRTRRFAANVIAFCGRLPQNIACQRIVPQLIDSSGSVDSNYRAACRARSKAEFIAKLGVAIEEADESKGWLQLLVESKLSASDHAAPLIQEADELLSILIRSRKTAESRKAEQDRLDKISAQRRTR